MLNILIRSYQPADFERLTVLWRIAREQATPQFQREKGHFFYEDQDYFLNHILAENAVWVAEVDHTPVAFMAICEDFIDQLYVHPNFWRQGIGRALLEHARKLSPARLWLYTLQENAKARAFYRKNGFKAAAFGFSPAPENAPDVRYVWESGD